MFLKSVRIVSMIIVPFCLTQTIDLAAAEALADPVIPEQCAASNFFRDIVGVDEEEFRKGLQWNETTGILDVIVNRYLQESPQAGEADEPVNLKSFDRDAYANWKTQFVHDHPRRQAIFDGEISFETVKELNDLIERKRDWEGNPKGQFTILLYDPKDPEKTDITALQANPENNNAVFQVASTMYGPVEGRIANPREYLGKMLICPWHGPAQGERASISAAGATIYRKYFMPTEIYMRRQAGEHIPGLVDNENYYYLLNAFGKKAPRKDQKVNVGVVRSHEFSGNDIPNVGIFTHANVDVTVKNTKNKDELQPIPLENAQRITQIFNAAHDMEFSYWPWDWSLKSQNAIDNEISFAKTILQGMYEGTLKKAYLLGKRKVFLTLLGGGVFKNDMKWVAEIFKKESIQQFIKDAGLDVYLIYRPVTNPTVLRELYEASYKINSPDAHDLAEENREVNRLMAQAMPLMESWWTRLKNWFWPAVGVGALSSAIIYSRYKANAAKENR